jgi:hypothetical protein
VAFERLASADPAVGRAREIAGGAGNA